MGLLARSTAIRRATLAVALVSVLVALAGCGLLQSPSSAPAASGPTATSQTAQRSPGPAATGGAGEPAIDLADSAQARIAAALAEGRIDYETSVRYRAYALFGDPQLPEEYLGEVVIEDAELFDEVQQAGDRLSPATREALLPYLVRPDDPRSIHAQPATGTVVPATADMGPASDHGGAVLAMAPGDEAVLCGANGWATLSNPKGYKVWSLCTGDYPAQVRFVYDTLDGIWDAEAKVMGPPIPDAGGTGGGGDSAIDVYLLEKWQCVRRDQKCRDTTYKSDDGGVGSALGIAPAADPRAGPAGARTSSGYILLARGAGFGSKLADTIAHELFHVIQNAYNWEGKYGGPGGYYHWLTESSAEWAGWHFTRGDRAGNAAWFSRFSGEPDVPLNTTPSDADRRYKAWPWHLFREIDSGGDAFMAQSWAAVKGKTSHQAFDVALDAGYPFASHFRDFAVKNLNVDLPGDPLAPRYRSVDDLLGDEVAIGVRKQLGGSPPGDIPTTWSEKVPRLTAAYAEIKLDDDVRQLRLDLSAFASAGDLDADLLIHLPSGWERRKVALGQTRFCRDRPGEDVSELYLVLSNHAFLPTSQPIEGDVQLEALAAGCTGGHGTVTISRDKHGTYTSARDNPVQVDMVDTATITFDLAPDEFDASTYTATHSSITWSYSLKAVESADGCQLIEGASGGGTWEADDGPSVLLGWGAPDGTLFGMVIDPERYVLNVTPPSQDLPDEDPRGWYQGNSTLCGGDIVKGLWLPYTTLAIVDGPLPDALSSLSGSRTRTLPPLGTQDLPITETVTWSVSLGP